MALDIVSYLLGAQSRSGSAYPVVWATRSVGGGSTNISFSTPDVSEYDSFVVLYQEAGAYGGYMIISADNLIDGAKVTYLGTDYETVNYDTIDCEFGQDEFQISVHAETPEESPRFGDGHYIAVLWKS